MAKMTDAEVEQYNVEHPDAPLCMVCQKPMPAGEEMFKYHGYSGPCPESESA